MKVFLGIGVKDIIPDHVVVDPLGGEGKVSLDFRNLDNVCDSGECLLIDAQILNHIHGSEVYNVINHWCSKLAHGGKIILGGTDMLEVGKLIVTGETGNADCNKVIYGVGNSSWELTKGMYEANEIAGILTEIGLKVDKKRIDGINYVVEAHRE